MESTLPRLSPRLITTKEAAELLHVSPRTIVKWIASDAIPYLRLPQVGERQEYRIPLAALLKSLGGNYDLAAELRILDAAALEAGVTDEDVLAALDEDDGHTG
jgi:excisionase family DNA binding protein